MDLDISDFGEGLSVDFGDAKKLVRSGSTCDAYECTIQRRHCFVKRLKVEFRDNPLYCAAFDKEYELGVSLNHISLPHYYSRGKDYIVMDYVEGETLGDLMRKGDERLRDKRFVSKILCELIDAVEYLHRRQVIHCDIKPDNLIVSPYDDRPITLIDLEKSYTAWLSDTASNPAKYDCTTCSDGLVDLNAICIIGERLGNKRIAALKGNKSLSIKKLRRAATKRPTNRALIAAPIAILLILGALVAYTLTLPSADSIIPPEPETPTLTNPAPKDSDIIAPPPVREKTITEARPLVPDTANMALINQLAQTEMPAVNEIIARHWQPVARMESDLLEMMRNDSTKTPEEFEALFNETINPRRLVTHKISVEIQQKYNLNYEMEGLLLAQKSNIWQERFAKDSEFSSDFTSLLSQIKAKQGAK